MENKTLILLRGLPGAGKSTLARSMGFTKKLDWFEADMYFEDSEGNYLFDVSLLHSAHQWCEKKVSDLMKNEIDRVCVSNTLTTEKELKFYLELAKIYNYKVVSLVVENRHGNASIHNVPTETLEKMKNRFSLKLM